MLARRISRRRQMPLFALARLPARAYAGRRAAVGRGHAVYFPAAWMPSRRVSENSDY